MIDYKTSSTTDKISNKRDSQHLFVWWSQYFLYTVLSVDENVKSVYFKVSGIEKDALK